MKIAVVTGASSGMGREFALQLSEYVRVDEIWVIARRASAYGATKAFVLSYSRSMNQELKPRGIRVMAMNPGWVKTEFFNHAFQTNGYGEVQYFDRLYEAKDVVRTGLKDLYRSRKDYSVHGLPVQTQVRLVKLLPHSLVMKIWLNQQKKAKNNTGLTTK